MTTTTPSAARQQASRSRSQTVRATRPLPAEIETPGRDTPDPSTAEFADCGVPSPYALAELIANRTIDWSTVVDRPALLEEIFQMPYAQIFDPTAGSPLYIGQTLQPDGTVLRARPKFAEKRPDAGNDLDTVADPDLGTATTLADLVRMLDTKALADIPVRNAYSTQTGAVVELGETVRSRNLRLSRIFDERLIDIIFPREPGYHPPGMTWQDMGRFYNETTEFLDPRQGGVGDCYFIAALASVAWSRPFTIADKTRATGMDNESFVHQISFFGSNGWQSVEVTDRILTSGGSGIQFASSTEAGEIWPAVYEKAYAKWRLGGADDFPAIPNIAGGDPSIACRALTGLTDYRNWHQYFTAAQILDLVKAHTSNGRTTSPMIAWTVGGATQVDRDAMAAANVIPGHAYSVLGWMRRQELISVPFSNHQWLPTFRRSVDYVVLRNPWGFSEGSGPTVAGGNDVARDVDWWRSIPLGTGGVFAMEITAYHRLFAGTGGAH